MKKRRTLKASFVVTFAASAAAVASAAGCNGNTQIITNPPPTAECPATVPLEGAPCDSASFPDACVYSDECNNDFDATCLSGAWSIDWPGISCNPPPALICPETTPVQGEACFGEGSCTYKDACGLDVTATCPSTTWEVMYPGTCNPPPACSVYGAADVCATDPTCRWLEPGCVTGTEIALPAAGCFPIDPCMDDAACNGGACTQVAVAPGCAAPECACGDVTSVCL